MAAKLKYTDEVLREVVQSSQSLSAVCRSLGIGRSGSAYAHIGKRIKAANIDTTHFLGRGSHGEHHRGGPKEHPPREILRIRAPEKLPRSSQLRRALVRAGVPYQCRKCGCSPTWQGEPLVLQVDHENGIKADCREENLRFLCPNCHSQTATFGARKLKRGERNANENGLQFIRRLNSGYFQRGVG